MTTKSSSLRYSTVADFELIVDGRSYSVAQIASDYLILETPTDLPPGPAILIIRVDDEVERQSIRILDSTTASTRVAIEDPDQE